MRRAVDRRRIHISQVDWRTELRGYYEGYSCEEISQFLGIPNATVRTRLRRGREQLKTNLQEANNDV